MMNTLIKASNKEKNKIKLFPVSFYADKLATIYDYENSLESFLPNLVEHILDQSENARIVVTPEDQFESIESFQEVLMEKGNITLSKSRKNIG